MGEKESGFQKSRELVGAGHQSVKRCRLSLAPTDVTHNDQQDPELQLRDLQYVAEMSFGDKE